MTRLFSRTDQSVFGRWWWTVDRFLLGAVLTLVICGVMLVTTASPPVAERIGLGEFHFIKRHLVFLAPSMVLLFGVSMLSPKMIWRLCSVLLPLGVLSLIVVLFVGAEIKGGQRWLTVFGFSLQPSEFMKPVFAVIAAWVMARTKDSPTFPGYKIALGLYLLIAMLFILQPDFGMTVVLSCIFGAQILLAGAPLIIIFGLGLVGLLGVVGAYFTLDHVQKRVDGFLNPGSSDSYQVDKALQAFKEGGIFGTGPGQGTVKLALPDAHSDFIFAVGAEEMGLAFALFLILLFGLIIVRGMNRVMDSKDMFIILAVGGVLVMMGVQALIHMGSSLHLVPPKGMTLPFVSYGGSSLLSVSFSMGIVLALTRRGASSVERKKQQKNKIRKPQEVPA